MPPKKVKKNVLPDLLSVLKAQKNPPIIPDLLQKVTENEILSFDAEDAEQFWKDMNLNFKVHLQILIPEEHLQEEERNNENKTDDSLVFMKSVLYLLEAKANTPDPYIPVIAVQMLIVLNGLILNPVFDEQLKIQTVKLCETWWKKNLTFRETLGENTIHYLLLNALQNGAPKNVTSRVYALRECLKGNFHLDRYLPLFSQISQNHNFLSTKDGQSFLGFVMALDEKIIRCIHDSAKMFIASNKKIVAVGYGHVYYFAWHSASPNLKKVIEEMCIQEFMEYIFTASRQGFDMSQLGQNIFRILREFHAHKIMSHVRTMLTDLYEPLLWRYLRSSNNIYRCNAAQVLFDVYPLERPGEGREEGLQLILKQHQIMEKLLCDEYHVIRSIAVKGVCRILSEYWEVISPNTIQKWMEIIVRDLANDGSYPQVRQNVFIGFKYLINKPMSLEYMQKILPEVQNHFHDANSRVRAAFVDMLITCKENGIKFWKIVPLEHLLHRLQVEEEEVGRLIVKLLFNSFFVYERGPNVTLKRIMNLILMNQKASRNFFLYSKPSFKTERAIQLMTSMLACMLQHVKSKLETNTEEVSNKPIPLKRKKKQKNSSKQKSNTTNSSQSKESTETTAAEEVSSRSEDIYSKLSFDNPIISLGFIEIVIILWRINAGDFIEGEIKNESKKFYKACCICLPTFLKYYKDTEVYKPVLYLCGLMPLKVMKIIRRSCNIESICLSQLKASTMDSSDEEILNLVLPLCYWNHGDDILEIARLWIDDAFRIDDLNASFCKSGSDKRRVKIKDIHEPKPLLGFRLLNTIFSSTSLKQLMLTKCYNHVLELWKYLKRIMILIENRIINGEPYNHSLLCDEFIEECFCRYVKLSLHLKTKSEENAPDVWKAVTDIIDWAERCLVPVLPIENPLIEESSQIKWIIIETSGPLLVKLLNEILSVATVLIHYHQANIDYYTKAIRLAKKLLSTGCKIKFVYSAMGLLLQIYNNNNNNKIFSKRKLLKVLMPLFNNCIYSFTDIAYSKDNINRYIERFAKLRNAISSFLMASLKNLSLSSRLFKNMTARFVDVIVKIISIDPQTLEHIQTIQKVQELPYVTAQFANLFLNKKDLCELFITMLCQNFKMNYITVPKLSASALGLLHVLSKDERRISLKVLISAVKSIDDVLSTTEMKHSNDSMDDCNENDYVSISRNLIKNMKKVIQAKSSNSKSVNDVIVSSHGPDRTDPATGLDSCDVVQNAPSQMILTNNENAEQTKSEGILVDDICKTAGNSVVSEVSQINESCLESSQLSISLMAKKRKLFSNKPSSLIMPENEQGISDINKSITDNCTNNHFANPSHQQMNSSILSPKSCLVAIEKRTCDVSANNCISEKQFYVGTTATNNEGSLTRKMEERKSSNRSGTRKSQRISSQDATDSITDEVRNESTNLTSFKTTDKVSDTGNNKSLNQTSIVHKNKRKLFSPNSKSIRPLCSSNNDEPLAEKQFYVGTTATNNEGSLTRRMEERKSSNRSGTRKSQKISSQDATDSITDEVRNESTNLTSLKTTDKVTDTGNNKSQNQTSLVHKNKRKLFSPNSKSIQPMCSMDITFNGSHSSSNNDEPLAKKPVLCSSLTNIARNERHKKQNVKEHSENNSLDISGIEEIRGEDLNTSTNLSNVIIIPVQDINSGQEISFVEKRRKSLIKSPLSTNKLHERTKETSFQSDNGKSDESNRKRRSSSRISDSHARNSNS